MLLIIEDYLSNNNIDSIFCCSYEQKFIDKLKEKFYKINYYFTFNFLESNPQCNNVCLNLG